MNQLVEINLIFQWFDHCLNTFTYQIVKINQISREKIISTQSHAKILGKSKGVILMFLNNLYYLKTFWTTKTKEVLIL